MAETRESPDSPDWQDTSTYEYTRALSRCGWAWEFLRRNEDYHRTWYQAVRAVTIEAWSPHLTLLTASAALPEMRRWGLIFHGLAPLCRDQCCRVLGSGRLPARAAHDGARERLSA